MDAVVVGADRIAANGDTANKIGTYMVAVLARQHDIPFYVAAPFSTVDLNSPPAKRSRSRSATQRKSRTCANTISRPKALRCTTPPSMSRRTS